MDKENIIVDGSEQDIMKATVESRAEGWFKVVSQQWHATFHLFVGTVEDLIKSGRDQFRDNPDILAEVEKLAEYRADADAAVGHTLRNDFVIRIKSYHPCLMDDMLTLSHECLHAAQMLLHNVGAEVDPAGSETLAYTHQFIFGRFMAELLKGARRDEEER